MVIRIHLNDLSHAQLDALAEAWAIIKGGTKAEVLAGFVEQLATEDAIRQANAEAQWDNHYEHREGWSR